MADAGWPLPDVRRLVDFGLLDQAPNAILDNVEAQAFPLLADSRRLQYFLDRHFNDTFESAGIRFDAVSPVVVFTTLFYPTMRGYDHAEASTLEQDEYYFLVPVRVRTWRDGKETEEVGVITPYIYVSNAISTPVGREIYGWQKSVYRLSRGIPRGARMGRTEPYLEVEQPLPGRGGGALEYRRVLAIRHRNEAGTSRFGETPSRLFETIDQLPRVATIAVRTMLAELGGALPGNALPRQLEGLGSLVWDLLHPNRELTVFSMVQFPHPSIGIYDEEGMPQFAAAYQALMRSSLRVWNLRDIGLLGTSTLASLDPSRGFSLRISGHGVDQVVTRLGLQVWECHRDDDDGETQIVHPFFPSGARFDLEVAALETLARRSALSPWTDGDGNVLAPRVENAAARYNTFLGPSAADGFASYGRTRHEQAYRILAVKADLETVRTLCGQIAPMPPGVTLTPRVAGDHAIVAFIANRVPPSREAFSRLEWFSGAYFNIAILADLAYEGVEKLVFVETHGFTDNPHAFVVGRELLAANRWLMEVDESPQTWLPELAATNSAPSHPGSRRMLRIDVDALRTRNAGERVAMSPLVDIVECLGEGEHHRGEADARADLTPHIAEIFRDRQLVYLRMDALRTVDADGSIRPGLVRCNLERVYFARPGVNVDPPTWLGPHELYVYPYASIPIVKQLGLYAEPPTVMPFSDPKAPAPQRVRCPVALGGRLPAARRGVLTLFECDDEGWRSNMLPDFFFEDDLGPRPQEWEPPVGQEAPDHDGHPT